MPATLAINWYACGVAANGTVPSETLVHLRSRHLLTPPLTYRIDRLIPKPFWKFWGGEALEETVLDAMKVEPGPNDPGGVYQSALWRLPVPPDQNGYVEFRAWTDSGEAYSGKLASARLWIEEEERTTGMEAEASAEVPGAAAAGVAAAAAFPAAAAAVAAATKFKPKVATKRSKRVNLAVRAPLDPPVRIRVLQGEDVLTYLRDAEAEVGGTFDIGARSMHNLPPDTMTYFVDRPVEDHSFDTFVGPGSPVNVEIHLPDVADLRAAIALEVQNIEDGGVTRTPPIFASHVGDRVVLTDLTLDMLRDGPRRILNDLAEFNEDVAALAQARREDVAKVWQRLIEATQELGAASVGDAAAFVAMGMRVPASVY
jgi:hypothetical protein